MTRTKKIGVICAGLLGICLVGVAVSFLFRPLNDKITIDGLSDAAASNDYILVKAEEEYYELQGSEAFAALFDFGAWQQEKQAPTEEPVLILRFAELWIVEFYSDGMAAAYNGYSAPEETSEAYYSLPPQVMGDLTAYIQQYGEAHELGDGAIGASTFRH